MIGRDGRIRAGDLLHPMQARWLLRYVPEMAGVMGLAPTFSIVTGWNLDSSNSRPEIGSRSWSCTNTRRFKGGRTAVIQSGNGRPPGTRTLTLRLKRPLLCCSSSRPGKTGAFSR